MASNEIRKRAAFLVRCSTNKQDYERQIEDLQSVADRFNLSVSEENIFGEYITGRDDTTKSDRISIVKLREAAEAKKFEYILVAEVSRMSRDSVSGRVYVRQFCNLGIPIYFRDKMKWTINPETMKEDESFIKELGLYFDGASEYLKSMKTQIASGRRSSLRNNQLVIGHVPIGYKKRGGKDKKHKSELIIDEDQAKIVRDIFAMYLEEHATLKSVALAISAKYNIRKTVSGIQQILARKEYYTGEYTVYMSDPDNLDKPSEPFTITFEPLIDEETFNATLKKRQKNKTYNSPYPKQIVHPLSRLIKCPFCGHSYSPRVRSGDKPEEKYRIINGKIAYSWKCMTRINNAGECESRINLNDEKTETVVWEFIKKELLSFVDLQKDSRGEKISQLKQKIADAEAQIPLYQQEINKTDNIIKRAYQAYMNAPDDAMDIALKNYNETLSIVKKTRDDYSQEIATLKDRIKSLQGSIEYYSQSNITADYIASIEDNDQEKRKIFLQLIEEIRPFSLSPGLFILELTTINGKYFILFDCNQRGEKRVAHYIAAPFVTWHTENEGKLKCYEPNSFFKLKNEDILVLITGLNTKHLSFREMEAICEVNGWNLPYNYIYKKHINEQGTQQEN